VLHGATEKEKTLNTFYSGGYGGYGWGGRGGGGGGGPGPPPPPEPPGGPRVGNLSPHNQKHPLPGRVPRARAAKTAARTRRSWPRRPTRCSRTSPPARRTRSRRLVAA